MPASHKDMASQLLDLDSPLIQVYLRHCEGSPSDWPLARAVNVLTAGE